MWGPRRLSPLLRGGGVSERKGTNRVTDLGSGVEGKAEKCLLRFWFCLTLLRVLFWRENLAGIWREFFNKIMYGNLLVFFPKDVLL